MNCKLVGWEQLALQGVPQMASPQKGSWRQPAQGCKTSGGRLPCTDRSGAEMA